MNRLKPEQIKAGRSYRLMARYTPRTTTIRRVIAVNGDTVVVDIKGEPKEFPLKVFADLAVEEVEQ